MGRLCKVRHHRGWERVLRGPPPHARITGFSETTSIMPSITCPRVTLVSPPSNFLRQNNALSCLSWSSMAPVPRIPVGRQQVLCVWEGAGRRVSSCPTRHHLGQVQHEPCTTERAIRVEGETRTTLEEDNSFLQAPADLRVGRRMAPLASTSPASVKNPTLAVPEL